ncbi:MAG: PAS domain S-box protein [Eubacteriales bacterium]
MLDSFYKQTIEKSPVGFAYHKIICNDSGVPCDYEFVEVNAAFEKLTGLKRSDIIGKRITKVIPNFLKDEFDWIGFYGDVALNGEEKELEQFSEALNKWYKVTVYSPEKYYFVTRFLDSTRDKKRMAALNNMVLYSEEFLQMKGQEIDYQKVTDDFLKLTGAKYAVFNLFDEDGESFTTKAVSGDKGIIKKAVDVLGFKLKEKKWGKDLVRAEKIKDHRITRFASMTDISAGVIPKSIITFLENTFKVGQVVLVKISKNNVMLGDFTLIMAKGEMFEQDSVAKLYTRQLGLVIERKTAEAQIVETKEYFRQMFSTSPDAAIITRMNEGEIENVNEGFLSLFGFTKEEAIGKKIEIILHDNLPDRVKMLTELKKNGYFVSDSTVFKKKDGSLFTGLFTSKMFMLKGVEHVSSNIRDISLQKQMEDALKESEEKYRHLIENSHDIIYTLTPEGLINFVSPAGTVQLGYTGPQVFWKPFTYIVHPDDRERVMTSVRIVIDEGQNQEGIEYRVKHLDGSWRWFSSSATPQKNIAGKIIGLEGIARDITDRKNTELIIHASEEKYRLITENMSDVVWVLNLAEEKFTYISPSVFNLRGLTVEEAMNEDYRDSLTTESYRVVKDTASEFIKQLPDNPNSTNSFTLEVQQICKNGDVIWVEMSANFRYGSDGNLEIVGASRNIESRKKAEEEIKKLSFHDPLTGLYNRRYFDKEMGRLNEEQYFPLTLIMADVNGLKLTNDAFGHKVGDSLLEKVAKIIKKECRTEDIVARIGGDEFVVLLPETDAMMADVIITRINKAIAKEKVENIIMSVSLGYAVKQELSENMNDVFKKAEDEMYRHKLVESSGMRNKTIDLIMDTLYERDNTEKFHSVRVGNICEAIASKMRIHKDEIIQIRLAGLMHDIGEIGVDKEILNATRELTEEDWKEIRRHPEIGYRILYASNEFKEIAEWILEHHERLDGKGYPRGVSEEQISIQARILSIADAYDAMTSERTFMKRLSEAEAIEEIKRCSGTQFDPQIAKVFIKDVLGKRWE